MIKIFNWGIATYEFKIWVIHDTEKNTRRLRNGILEANEKNKLDKKENKLRGI